MFSLIAPPNQNKFDPRRTKKASFIQYGLLENEQLVHECFPKDLRMGTARMNEDKVTEEEDKQESVKIESRVST